MVTLSTRLVRALAASLLLLVLGGAAIAVAAPGDIGHRDGSYSGASGSPSGSKPESKVWFNDGIWWASEWSNSPAGFYIHKLNTATETLVSTGVALDTDRAARQDTLWDGTKLYVASQNFSDSGALTGGTAFLCRYSYDAGTRRRTAWTMAFPQRCVRTSGPRRWSSPRTRPGCSGPPGRRIRGEQSPRLHEPHRVATTRPGRPRRSCRSAIRASASRPLPTTSRRSSPSGQRADGRIGVFWSNQDRREGLLRLARRGAADTAWTAETVVPRGSGNPRPADDHINLKADSNGRVYAIVKTSKNTSGSPPEIELHIRQPGGGWSAATVANGQHPHPADRRARRGGRRAPRLPDRPNPARHHRRPERRHDLREDVVDVVDLVPVRPGHAGHPGRDRQALAG